MNNQGSNSVGPKLNQYFQPIDAPVGIPSTFVSALQQDNNNEYKPTTQPHVVSKGSLSSTAGGVFTLYDATGGTKILTYNPDTGVVTILGSLIAQSSSTGTYSGITLAGNIPVIGTMQNGVYGTALYLGGTLNSAVMGSPTITGGEYNSGTFPSAVLSGTPLLTINAGSPTLGANGNFALETFGTGLAIAARIGGTTFYWLPTGTLT